MSKPIDIPQRIWDAATAHWGNARANVRTGDALSVIEIAARAMIAERERCARIVEDYTTTTRRDVDEVLVRRKTASVNSIALAAAIRNGVPQ